MTFLLESLAACALFSLFVFLMSRDPVKAVFNYPPAIIERCRQPGILVTTKTGDKINSMTIGWGTLGVVWEKPVFIAYVRDCRYTWEMLQKNPEFTVNIPVGEFDRKALGLLDQKQDDSRLPEELRDRFYRIQSNDHFCFYGEIVASYMIEP